MSEDMKEEIINFRPKLHKYGLFNYKIKEFRIPRLEQFQCLNSPEPQRIQGERHLHLPQRYRKTWWFYLKEHVFKELKSKNIYYCDGASRQWNFRTQQELSQLLTDNKVKGRSKMKTKEDKIRAFFKLE